jgi:hypothetical protein
MPSPRFDELAADFGFRADELSIKLDGKNWIPLPGIEIQQISQNEDGSR